MQKKSKKRARTSTSATSFSFHTVLPETAPAASQRIHRHLCYNTGEDGRVASTVNFFEAPASPEKAAPVPRWADEIYEDPLEEDIQPPVQEDLTDTGFVDPDYVTFLNEITLEPLPSKRRRPKSVGFNIALLWNTQTNGLSTLIQDFPLHVWATQRDEFLMEVNRLEGRGDHRGHPCGRCGSLDPCFRCRDCDGCELYCQTCIVSYHSTNFLHRIQVCPPTISDDVMVTYIRSLCSNGMGATSKTSP